MSVINQIRQITRAPGFRDSLADLLLEICAVDTTPNSDVAVMRQAESRVFDVLERELAVLDLAGAECERRPVDPAIANHPAFSQLHFTKTPDLPKGLSAAAAYAGRCNLLFSVPGARVEGAGDSVALNAHIDIVAPHIPPRTEGQIVYGRGACDDKGPVVAIIGALRVLAGVSGGGSSRLSRALTAMFVIEEETGGNGSLSLALDRELRSRVDSLLVMECTDGQVHPANRGAVWYAARLAVPGLSLLELASFVIEEFENEGRAIKTESRHPLFPQRPVQTCHGIIGGYGRHPSAICGEVSFRLRFPVAPTIEQETLVRDCVDSALAEYVGVYGDKTTVVDPETGRPKVDHHVDMRIEGAAIAIDVHGSTGHMGAILENDGAITKMATIVRALVRSRGRLGDVTFELVDQPVDGELIIEGGQGFVPTHPIDEIMARMRAAAQRGAANYMPHAGQPAQPADAVGGVTVTFDKLHNAAYDGDPDSNAMRRARAAAEAAGLPQGDTVVGWTVSCDARLFATEYPEMPVLTFGPGKLTHAHSEQEQLDLDELVKSVEMLALFVLSQTGTVG